MGMWVPAWGTLTTTGVNATSAGGRCRRKVDDVTGANVAGGALQTDSLCAAVAQEGDAAAAPTL